MARNISDSQMEAGVSLSGFINLLPAQLIEIRYAFAINRTRVQLAVDIHRR